MTNLREIENNKNHISIIIDNMNGGGAERVCIELVRYLLKQSYTVDLILCDFHGELLREIPLKVNLFVIDEMFDKKGNVPNQCSISYEDIQWINPKETIGYQQFFRHFVLSWPYWPKKIPRRKYRRIVRSFAMAKYFVSRKPNLILAILPASYYYALMGLKIGNISIPIICSIRNTVKFTRRFLLQRTYKKLLRHSDWVHTVSSGIANEVSTLRYFPKEKITTIFNPSCRPQISQLAKLPTKHPWVESKHDHSYKFILAVGRLAKQKNYSLLINAFARIVPEINAKLIILGEGDERKHLENLVNRMNLSNHVSMPGWVKNPYSFMNQADVFVSSSDFEGHSNVLIEALYCGCNIVATNCPQGSSEILGDGRWGNLVPCNDRRALTKAILESLNSKPNRELLINRAMEFTPNRIFPQYENLINAVIRKQYP